MKKNSSFLKRLLSFILVISLVFIASAPQAYADELDDLKAKSERLAKQIAESEAKLAKTSKDKNKQEQIIKELNKQIAALQEQIAVLEASLNILKKDVNSLSATVDTYNANIKTLEKKIKDAEDSIDEKQAFTEETRQKALERVRVGYVAGNPSKLEILLSSKDMTVLFYNIELLKQLSKRDEELIDKLKGETEELKTIKTNMEKDKADLLTTKKELDGKLAALKSKKADQDAQARSLNSARSDANSKVGQAKDAVGQLDKNSAAYKAQLAKLQKEREEADRLIDAYIAQHGSSSDSPKNEGNEGDFAFPLPYSSCYFSALFGTYPSGGAHYGLDTCVSGGTMGKNIIAAQGGKVITATWHSSYGNYVVVDHGAGMFTLYAHCSKLLVSKDQSVKKGQKLAEAGSTGNSTGAHLHFEVRLKKNGSIVRVNPLPYFPGKPNKVGVTFSGL